MAKCNVHHQWWARQNRIRSHIFGRNNSGTKALLNRKWGEALFMDAFTEYSNIGMDWISHQFPNRKLIQLFMNNIFFRFILAWIPFLSAKSKCLFFTFPSIPFRMFSDLSVSWHKSGRCSNIWPSTGAVRGWHNKNVRERKMPTRMMW